MNESSNQNCVTNIIKCCKYTLKNRSQGKILIINYLMYFFSDETDLRVPLDNDDWLVRFLRPSKFYPDSARDLVSNKKKI